MHRLHCDVSTQGIPRSTVRGGPGHRSSNADRHTVLLRSDSQVQELPATILGTALTVRATPHEYLYTYGDGTTFGPQMFAGGPSTKTAGAKAAQATANPTTSVDLSPLQQNTQWGPCVMQTASWGLARRTARATTPEARRRLRPRLLGGYPWRAPARQATQQYR